MKRSWLPALRSYLRLNESAKGGAHESYYPRECIDNCPPVATLRFGQVSYCLGPAKSLELTLFPVPVISDHRLRPQG